MNPAADITPEEMEVFLQEADEQLQLLDEDFIILEKEGADSELLQEIFRAAHTIKGSSAMVGFENMSQVAHAMETILDKLRNGTLAVSTPVINALLSGLDVLRELRAEVTSPRDTTVDLVPVVEELERVGSGEGPAAAVDKGAPEAIGAEGLEKLEAARANGNNAYHIVIEIDPESSWASVRSFQIITELSQVGEVVYSIPSPEAIERGEDHFTLELILVSDQEPKPIEESLGSISELSDVKISTYNPEDGFPASAAGQGAGGGKKAGAGSAEPAQGSQNKVAQVSQTVRVDVKLLDRLMNLVGEMVIDRNRIGQIGKELVSKHGGDETVEALGETSGHITKVVNELQETILKARMLPIGTVFNGFPRLVRDLAQKAGKKVNLIIEGRETELDRTIIEQIRDPLLHLLRNSVDHGLEPADKRQASGKSEEGMVLLKAYQEQNHIIIEVADDGGGIDVQAVRDSTVKKGFKSQDEVAKLSDADAVNLIFGSGVSTAKKVTEVSGRGVGMDVVKTNIQSLGGTVNLETKLGEGTKFTLRLPLTLATINGLLVISGQATYVIPMASMVEVLRLNDLEVTNVMGTEVIRIREDILPLLDLNRAFGRRTEGPSQTREGVVVVVKAGDKSVGLTVDSVMEPQEIVIKSLGDYMGGIKGVVGSTILGDGRLALILDTASLVRQTAGV